MRDSLTWKWTNNGVFSVESAYNIQFEGRIATDFHLTVWDSDGPRKWQFYALLAAWEDVLLLMTWGSVRYLITQFALCASFTLKLLFISFLVAPMRNKPGNLLLIAVR
jgi:hypothetical protein